MEGLKRLEDEGSTKILPPFEKSQKERNDRTNLKHILEANRELNEATNDFPGHSRRFRRRS